ncbi:uncharacterized protein LOC135834291 [Planococcus citri]|uniref:uncharacterized protein LOC135834291 n=1 Tax=Planococcus citri TaxID=170843 RepID=UPI0031F7D1A0
MIYLGLTIFASCLCFPNDAFPLAVDLNTRVEEYFVKLNITDPTSNERLIARDLIYEREKAEAEARQQRERAKGAEDAKKTVQKELNKFKYPVTIGNEIDTFFEIHDWKVNITAAEDKMIKQIGDQQRRVRVKLVKICEHIISDLNSTDPDIQDLNEEIDSPNNQQLKKIADPSKRRNVFCNALVWAKVKRNKIHDLIADGTDLKKYNIFVRESWNECLSIFVNVLTAKQGLKESEEELDIPQS